MLPNATDGMPNLICLDHERETSYRDVVMHLWHSLFDSDAGARADQHPQYATTSAATRGRSLWAWLGHCDQASEAPRTMAILEQRPFIIRPVPRLRILQSRALVLRLVGTRLLGEQSDQQAEHLLENLQRHLRSQSSTIQGVYLEEVDEDTAVGHAIAKRRATHAGRSLIPWALSQPHWYLRFPECREDYWHHFSGRRRQKLRREQRLCGATLQVITRPEDVGKFVQGAEFVSERSWQGRDFGLRVRDNLTTVNLFQQLATLGFFRAYLLIRDGQPIAFTHGTLHNGCYMFEETGYDTSASNLSPGKVLLMEIVNDLIRLPGVQLIDFGFGHASYKEQFGTDSGAISSWLLLGPKPWPKMMARSKSIYSLAIKTARESCLRLRAQKRAAATG